MSLLIVDAGVWLTRESALQFGISFTPAIMRLAVRHQLSTLLIVSTSIGLTTLAVATWLANHDFVLKVARDGMETAASTKAVGIAIGLDLMYSSCLYLTASAALQTALDRYNQGSTPSRRVGTL